MKTLLLPICGALAACGIVASRATTDRDVASSSQQRLVFSDGFRGSELDRGRWSTCYWWARRGCTIATNHELEWYRPGQVRVRGGALALVADRRKVRGIGGRLYRFVSGMVNSGPPYGSRRPKFAFRYGTAEIRARLPAGRGLWPAFWLLPADRESKPEIDVMEAYGQTPATVQMHLHYRAANGEVRVLGRDFTDPGLRSGWHRFAISWRPRKLVWLIDGVRRWRLSGDAVPDEPMYPIVDLAVGGDGPGAPDRRTRFPSVLEVDYLKVWR
jgi:beta-glucanase (GH16 family)